MSDAKYFTTTKKGELAELRADLQGDKRDKKKDAIKKIIANMTVGKDVSSLFPDIVNCMQTDNLELKKLVYLYLMNYAKSQPDLAILAVNTFSKDCEDPNPLIRALAVRTMGCIRVDKITEYLCDPLRKCLKDEDPYVRKTAAVCVAKLHDINSQLVEEQGFLDLLRELLSDSVPMVVANAVASLAEISETSPAAADLGELDTPAINKLLTALNECTEWGQVFILDSISNYHPSEEREAQSICERVTPRLSHANAAVVLSAVKVLMQMMDILPQDSGYLQGLTRKLAPPLVTLLSTEAEIQYVALRNINLIVQKRPEILRDEIKVFFVKYNDPIYVKLEKLDVMIRLCTSQNISSILSELKEYATEVDVDFVRKSVRAIGRCAIKVESSADKCVSTLVDLIQTKVTYVVQEAIVVIKDIFRKYPNQYEGIISTLCQNLDSLDEPDARASMIWILGEYCDRIDEVEEILGSFLEGFQDENPQVQLQLLTAVVKLFLKKPTTTQELVQMVLTKATQDTDNPDLRDRGYIYWRLLSTDPAAAKEVVLAEKPVISEETDLLEPSLLDELLCHISTLASVYHKPPSAFVEGKIPVRKITLDKRPQQSESETTEDQPPEQLSAVSSDTQPTPPQDPQDPGTGDLLGDLLSLDLPSYNAAPPTIGGGGGLAEFDMLSGGIGGLQLGGPLGGGMVTAPPPASMAGLGMDFFSLSAPAPQPNNLVAPKTVWLNSTQGKGLEISGTFARRNGKVFLDATFTNKALGPMSDFAIQFNKNSFGLAPAAQLYVQSPLFPNQPFNTSLELVTGGVVMLMNPLDLLQVAVKNNVGVFYFSCNIPAYTLFVEDGKMDRKVFLSSWKELPSSNEVQKTLSYPLADLDSVKTKLEANNVFIIAERTVGEDMQVLLYVSTKLINGLTVLGELKILRNGQTTLSLKTNAMNVVPLVQSSLDAILSQ
ncbi:PREDICTED: AP-1 complex subunit beta-1-like [Amphimedon queenslandica]|uniref:AP complex subunit beta n=1 Tax=Amphimedon queenslandica TaxID=400682 RepID=A0A1X7VJV4_AMPQE|nr:PREDICTED: AP-1 complex subunit beta-1-like [Amphimedon queenslandica]|eukprot:XP_003384157.1 PREDICTED: AP-1 complex subunit beta-1-like [Amphimedon queenslandica]